MHLIVGIDPGTTAGIAILNFNGDLIDLSSSKNMGIDEVIKHITRFGTVSVVAADVSPVPQFVNKLSAVVGAVVFKPYVSLSINGKKELTKNFMYKDAHQRDSLAAGLNAFNKFKNKFAKIDALDFDALGIDKEKKGEIKHLVIRGHSIDSIIKNLTEERGGKKKEKIEEEEEEFVKEESPEIKKIRLTFNQRLAECNSTIKELENQNVVLRNEIESKEKELAKLNDKILVIKRKYDLELQRDKKLREDGQVIQSFELGMKDLRERLNEKLDELAELAELWNSAAKGHILPVGIFPEKFDGMSWLRRKLRKKDYKNLIRTKILFISNPCERKDLIEKRLILCDEKYIKELGGCAYINADELEIAKNEAEELKYKMTKVDEKKLLGIIEGYRSDRR